MMTYPPRYSRDQDSWSAIFRPPLNESVQEKQSRIARQQEAARISKEIDDAIEKSRKLFEKRKRSIKVLLLGPSLPPRPSSPHPLLQARPSPASPPSSEVCLSLPAPPPCSPCCRPDFQLAFCPTYFHREIPVWKVIIQLNLIGYVSSSPASPCLTLHSSVKRLLAIIEDELDSVPASPSHPNFSPGDQSIATLSSSSGASSSSPASATIKHPLRQASLDPKNDSTDPPLTQAHAALRLRLLPLLSAETSLARLLLPEFGGEAPPLPSSTGWSKWASGAGGNAFHHFLQGNGEICVRAGGAWKSTLERVTGTLRNSSDTEDPSSDDYLTRHIEPRSTTLSGRPSTRTGRPHPSDPTPLLEALAPDIHALWTDPAVRALLKRKGILMEHSAGFFLNDVLRIAHPGWQPDISSYFPLCLRSMFLHLSQTTLYELDLGPLALTNTASCSKTVRATHPRRFPLVHLSF